MNQWLSAKPVAVNATGRCDKGLSGVLSEADMRQSTTDSTQIALALSLRLRSHESWLTNQDPQLSHRSRVCRAAMLTQVLCKVLSGLCEKMHTHTAQFDDDSSPPNTADSSPVQCS